MGGKREAGGEYKNGKAPAFYSAMSSTPERMG